MVVNVPGKGKFSGGARSFGHKATAWSARADQPCSADGPKDSRPNANAGDPPSLPTFDINKGTTTLRPITTASPPTKLQAEEAFGERLLQRLQHGEGDAHKYDAVFIDEAQDFSKSWFLCSKLALKEPDDGDLLIVGEQ